MKNFPWHLLSLAGAITWPILILSLAGYFADKKIGSSPWITVIAIILGLIISFFNLYRFAKQAQQQLQK